MNLNNFELNNIGGSGRFKHSTSFSSKHNINNNLQEINFINQNFNLNNSNLEGGESNFDAILRFIERIDENTFKKIKGNLFKIVVTQNGSRSLQKAVKKTNKEILFYMFEELQEHLCALMTDNYGNYFCQKFYCYLALTERIKFLNIISREIVEISRSKVGTYTIQAFIECVTSREEKVIFVNLFLDKFIEICQVNIKT